MKRGLLVLVISLVCLIFLAGQTASTSRAELLLTPTPAPDSPPLTGRIAYTGYPGEGENYDFEIFVMDLATREVTQLTDDADAANYFPYWSPDGEHILYFHSPDGWQQENPETGVRSLYVMNADGTKPVRLTTDDMPDVVAFPLLWSPNSQFVLFNSFDRQIPLLEMYAARVDGSELNRLLFDNLPGVDPSDDYPYARWTLDNRLIFMQDGMVYRLNPDGSDAELLLEGVDTGIDTFFFLTPDEEQIVVSDGALAEGDTNFSRLWLIDMEDGAQEFLAELPEFATVYDLFWSPDGRWLTIYVETQVTENGVTTDTTFGMFILDLDAEGRSRNDWRSICDGSDRIPATWSPDSRFLTYAAPTENEFSQIFAISPEDGSVPIQLTTNGGVSPDWHD